MHNPLFSRRARERVRKAGFGKGLKGALDQLHDGPARVQVRQTRQYMEAADGGFAALVAAIETARFGRGRGKPQDWIKAVTNKSSTDIAAGIIAHVIGAQHQALDELMPAPLASSVGTRIGVDLLTDGAGEGGAAELRGGVQLLGLAAEAAVIDPLTDAGEGEGYRVRVAEPVLKRIAALVPRAAPHILTQVSSVPRQGISVRLRRDHGRPRPDVGYEVSAACDKLQATPWAINRDVLAVLESTDAQLGYHSKNDFRECDTEALTAIANARQLATLERFYLRGSLDYRGRYNQRSAFQYTGGSEVMRGLLQFADGEVLDKDGRRWLSWQMSQHWGAGAEIPLGDGSRWFKTMDALKLDYRDAKHPVQFLAAQQAYAADTCHIPIRLDASCSGMQHLSLMLRDIPVGRMVNLNGDTHGLERKGARVKPVPDMYTLVRDRVRSMPGYEGIDRDQIKCVMVPRFYGSGADECAKKLAESDTPPRARARAADVRLAKAIIAAGESLAPREFELLKWFGKVAAAHKARGIPMCWTTPSGFYALMDYRHMNPGVCDVNLEGKTRHFGIEVPSTANDHKQQQVAAPSAVIHSFDASLLMLIVNGLDTDRWAVAHDAFGVPAGRAWDLTAACERALGEMYRPDRLEELAAAWRDLGVDIEAPPKHPKRLPRRMLGGLRTIA